MVWPLLVGYASVAAATAACFGMLQSWAGVLTVSRFAARPAPPLASGAPVSVLKPLHGDEPLLEEALASFCVQDYPEYQLVFGVADLHDPAIEVVNRLRRRFPAVDIVLVVNDALHGSNRKVSNLINIIDAARHERLVIADSDVHASTDYLSHVIAELEKPGTGLVTTLSLGLAASARLPEQLAAAQITYGFLPGVLLARALGRQDCLGITMAIRRATLQRVGGLQALADHLADDAVLGGLVQAQGMSVRLASTLPATTVAESTLRTGFEHELRWARTIRTQAPAGYAASILQYPLAWAVVALVLSGLAPAMIVLVVAAWTTRWLAGRQIDRILRPMVQGASHGRALQAPFLLFPLREAVSVAVMLASYRTRRVTWRGYTMVASRGPGHGTSAAAQRAQPAPVVQRSS